MTRFDRLVNVAPLPTCFLPCGSRCPGGALFLGTEPRFAFRKHLTDQHYHAMPLWLGVRQYPHMPQSGQLDLLDNRIGSQFEKGIDGRRFRWVILRLTAASDPCPILCNDAFRFSPSREGRGVLGIVGGLSGFCPARRCSLASALACGRRLVL